MTDKIILITEPDDIQIDGCRILLVDLTEEQNQMVSQALNLIDLSVNLLLYVAKESKIDWVLDKKNKSRLIVFNAESTNDLLVGYLSASAISHYMGNLKILNKANPRIIYSAEDLVRLFNKQIGMYEQR